MTRSCGRSSGDLRCQRRRAFCNEVRANTIGFITYKYNLMRCIYIRIEYSNDMQNRSEDWCLYLEITGKNEISCGKFAGFTFSLSEYHAICHVRFETWCELRALKWSTNIRFYRNYMIRRFICLAFLKKKIRFIYFF